MLVLTQQTGETAEGFKARQDAARAFTTRQQSLAGLAPQVAARDALQAQAQKLATSRCRFFSTIFNSSNKKQLQAQHWRHRNRCTNNFSTRRIHVAVSTQVIDTTLAEFDRNAAIKEQQHYEINKQALGAFGAGRAGVQLAEFGTGAARERALLQAGLLQQGFAAAQTTRHCK